MNSSDMIAYIKKLTPYILILLITLFFVHGILSQALVWGDFSFFGKESFGLVHSSFFYTWSHENFGTTPRMSFGKILPLMVVSMPFVGDHFVYLFLRVLPIFIIPLVAFRLLLILTNDRRASFIAAIFSIANPAVLGDIMNGQTLWIYPIVLSLFYLSIKIFFRHEFTLFGVVLFALVAFFALGVLPPIIIPLAIVLIFFNLFAFFEIKNGKTFLKVILTVFGSLLLFLCISFPYLFVVSSGQEAYTAQSTIQDYYHNYSETKLLNTIRLAGNAGNGQETLGYNESSYSNAFGYLIFLVIVIGFLNIIKRDEKETKKWFLFALLATLLILLGFIQLITIDKDIGTSIFASQWLAGTIRNPTKLFVILLQIFVIMLAYSLTSLFEKVKGAIQKYLLGLIILICISIYSWPVLRGDFGLFYITPMDARLQNSSTLEMVEIANSREGRALIIPSDHNDELRYENLSTNLNSLRLGGGYPPSQELRNRLVFSFNEQSTDFDKYIDVAGFGTIFLKKGSLYKTNQFSLFPVFINFETAKAFLDKNYKKITETEDFIAYSNPSPSLVYSPSSILNFDEAIEFDDVAALYSNKLISLISLNSKENIPFLEKYTHSGNANTPLPKNSTIVLRNPDIVDVGIKKTIKKGVSYIGLDKLPALIGIGKRTGIFNTQVSSRIDLLKIDNKVVDLRNENPTLTTRSGLHTVTLINLQRIEDVLGNLSFEKSGNFQAGDASVGRGGASKINTKISSDSSEGKRSLLLESQNHLAYYKVTLPIREKSHTYYLSFDYKNVQGLAPSFSVYENGLNKSLIFGQLSQENTWTTASVSFSPDTEATSIDLYFYTDSESGRRSQNLFDNIALYKENEVVTHAVYFDSYERSVNGADLPTKEILDSNRNISIKNSSFEDEGLSGWNFGDASVGKGGDPEIKYSFVSSGTDGQRSVQLNSKNHTAYISKRILDSDLDASYQISFDYKHLSGNNPSFAVWQSGANKSSPSGILQSSTKDWSHFETLFTPDVGATGAYLYFYTSSSNGEESINLFDNVKLEKVSRIKNYLIPISNSSYSSPNLTVENINEINPSLYKITVKGNKGLLVLNESFHSGWSAYVDTENRTKITSNLDLLNMNIRPISEESHVMVNGFANGWVVNNQKTDGEYQIILEFVPQRWFYLGLLISGTTLVLCLGYLGYDAVRRCRDRKVVSSASNQI